MCIVFSLQYHCTMQWYYNDILQLHCTLSLFTIYCICNKRFWLKRWGSSASLCNRLDNLQQEVFSRCVTSEIPLVIGSPIFYWPDWGTPPFTCLRSRFPSLRSRFPTPPPGQSDPKVTSEWFQSDPRVIQMCPQSDPRVHSEWSQSGKPNDPRSEIRDYKSEIRDTRLQRRDEWERKINREREKKRERQK